MVENRNQYFKANYMIEGTIILETGLHIGDSKDSIEIGVIDNPIIKDKSTGYPYIPGSSLKGKLRTLIELTDSKYSNSDEGKKGEPSKNIELDASKIFGISPDKADVLEDDYKIFPTRLIVRDSFPVIKDDEDEKWDQISKWDDQEDVINGAEVKYENTIDKISAQANPRPIERIPKGSKFLFNMVLSEYGEDNTCNNLKLLFKSMKLLQDSYLGGSGSRGYGQIKFENITIKKRDNDYYINDGEASCVCKDKSLKDINNELCNFFKEEDCECKEN